MSLSGLTRAQTVELKVSENILPEFNIGFDKRIPTDVEQELRSFVTWVENNYRIPITLWVDFEYNHYLISRSGKRVGYLFYWADFSSYPTFSNCEDIPEIRLPVRTEHSTMEEILTSFIEAITDSNIGASGLPSHVIWLPSRMVKLRLTTLPSEKSN